MIKNQITFDDFDKLNLKLLGEDILRIIKGDKNFARDQKACTISLNAGFGQGKTTFLEMLKIFLETQELDKEGKRDGYAVLFIDAWRDDFSKEPIIAIFLKFLEYLKNQNQNNEIIKRVLRLIGNLTTNIPVSLVRKSMGFYLQNLGLNPEFLKKELKDLNKKREDIIGEEVFDELQQKQKILTEIKSIISGYTGNDKKLVIIVDELDRARPDYAVHFLEDMKHFFDIENVVFIFGINKSQIKATVKTLYGQDIEFDGYYAKFFKHEMDLPDPYIEALNFIDLLLKEIHIPFDKFDDQLNHSGYLPPRGESDKLKIKKENIIKIYLSCKTLNLTLREINSFLRIFEFILKEKSESSQFFHESYLSTIIFFTCLYIKKRNIFNEILTGAFEASDFFKFINEDGFKSYIKHPPNYSLSSNTMNTYKNRMLYHVAISIAKCDESRNIITEDWNLIEEEFSKDSVCIEESDDSGYGPLLNIRGQAMNLCRQIAKRKSLFKD